MPLRSPVSRLAAIALAAADASSPASAAGGDLAAALAAATTISARARASADGATICLWATRIRSSSSAQCRIDSSVPFFVAWRNRCASNGWSLRRKLPITNTRSSIASSAIDMPSQGAAGACCVVVACAPALKSVSRRRKSMLSLPRPRTNFCVRCSSSSVECGEASAATAAAA